MQVVLGISTLGHRAGATVDIDDDIAAQLIAGGHAHPVAPPAAAVAEPVAPVDDDGPLIGASRRRAGLPPAE